MSMRLARIFGLAAAGLLWLAGCETFKTYDLLGSRNGEPSSATAAAPDADPQATGSVAAAFPPTSPGLLGGDPADDLSTGKKQYRAGNFGVAEQHFRRAAETHPNDAEAWLGLAACYDRLRRFDLADRAYAQAIRIVGPRPEILNNQGFSYMLRGDYRRAREKLLAARAANPNDPHAQANLRLLDESFRQGKAIE